MNIDLYDDIINNTVQDISDELLTSWPVKKLLEDAGGNNWPAIASARLPGGRTAAAREYIRQEYIRHKCKPTEVGDLYTFLPHLWYAKREVWQCTGPQVYSEEVKE